MADNRVSLQRDVVQELCAERMRRRLGSDAARAPIPWPGDSPPEARLARAHDDLLWGLVWMSGSGTALGLGYTASWSGFAQAFFVGLAAVGAIRLMRGVFRIRRE